MGNLVIGNCYLIKWSDTELEEEDKTNYKILGVYDGETSDNKLKFKNFSCFIEQHIKGAVSYAAVSQKFHTIDKLELESSNYTLTQVDKKVVHQATSNTIRLYYGHNL